MLKIIAQPLEPAGALVEMDDQKGPSSLAKEATAWEPRHVSVKRIKEGDNLQIQESRRCCLEGLPRERMFHKTIWRRREGGRGEEEGEGEFS